jgi:hypothetical protein
MFANQVPLRLQTRHTCATPSQKGHVLVRS